MSVLDALSPKYRLILCDVWGVVHDGVRLLPGAPERLARWRAEGRCICLITNAPRTAESVERQLSSIGLSRLDYSFIATSGEAGIEALIALGRPVGFLGTDSDREILERRGVRIHQADFTDLACTGILENRPRPQDYRQQLEDWARRNVQMHCLNPDRLVLRGGKPEACAGAIADLYETLGGRVTWYGKPHPAIYGLALQRAGNPHRDEVLAIGDGLQTDMLGAARMGFDAVFVTGGIHQGQPFPPEFAAANALGDWEPIAVTDTLA